MVMLSRAEEEVRDATTGSNNRVIYLTKGRSPLRGARVVSDMYVKQCIYKQTDLTRYGISMHSVCWRRHIRSKGFGSRHDVWYTLWNNHHLCGHVRTHTHPTSTLLLPILKLWWMGECNHCKHSYLYDECGGSLVLIYNVN